MLKRGQGDGAETMLGEATERAERLVAEEAVAASWLFPRLQGRGRIRHRFEEWLMAGGGADIFAGGFLQGPDCSEGRAAPFLLIFGQ